MKIKYLSYPLSENTPAYGGGDSFIRKFTKEIAKGDSCNQIDFSMSNHLGTHIDAPLHFFAGGKSITDLPAEFWHVSLCGFIEYTAQRDQMIRMSELNLTPNPKMECLLLKTDFGKYRGQEDYWKHGPGISADSADFLRSHFPKLRFICFDFMSLTSFQNREEGRRAHRTFLGSDCPILVVEDMDLSDVTKAPIELTISPLRIDNGDGAPVTVFAKFD